jgi:hypothetical protein
MARYTVVIRPEGEGDDARGAATVVVETGPQAPRIVEMTIRASSADGVSMVAFPSIDLEGVVRALSAGVRAAEPAAAPNPTPTPDPAPSPALDTVDQHENADTSQAPPEPKRRSDRPYRQMPAAEELKAVYERVGTVTAVAAHYGVPRHTASGWMTRLRKMIG